MNRKVVKFLNKIIAEAENPPSLKELKRRWRKIPRNKKRRSYSLMGKTVVS